MIDVRLLRNNPDDVRAALARRGKADLLVQLDSAIALDARLREIMLERDSLRRQVNDLSKQVAQLRKAGDAAAETVMAESRALGEAETALATETEVVEASLRDVLLRIPNLPHADAPNGTSDNDNPVVSGPHNVLSEYADYQRVPHWETASDLGLLDNARAVKISGAMFTMQRGLGATMARALCQYALDTNADEFEEIRPPSLVTSAGGGNGVAPTVTVEAEAGAVSNTGMVTEYLTGTVQKYSGMNTLSVELLERSDPNFYAELTQQLQNAYLTTIDTAVVAALVSAGTNATATTADSDGIIAFASQSANLIYSYTGYFAQNYIGNGAQWQLLMSATDSTKRPIYSALQPMNAAGQVGPRSIRGNVLGLDLYVDKNFTASTVDDDSAIILAPEAFTVYRSPQAYMSVNVVSNLQVQVAIYGFMATIAKMPNGIRRYQKA